METKILQIGEGNFLRGFFDWMVQRMNDRAGFDGSVQVIQPRGAEFKAVAKALNAQGGRYHLCLRGLEGGKTVEKLEEISVVKGVDLAANIEKYATVPSIRFVVSNTTEVGIQYVKGEDTFPAKLARFLRARFAAGLPGVVVIPTELIENNGRVLKEYVLNYLRDFAEAGEETASVRQQEAARETASVRQQVGVEEYVERECVFCSTLVDRIVSGRPDEETAERFAKELGERDEALICGEPFHFFAIEPPAGFDLEKELPLKAAGVNVVYAADITPYRERKLRFLNAAHTSIVYYALERGFEEVAQFVEDKEGNAFLRKILFEEIFPTMDLPDDEKREFAEAVLERFANPFAHHKFASISLNTIAKWKVRCLPIVCEYYRRFGKYPENMMLGYDAIARHYDKSR